MTEVNKHIKIILKFRIKLFEMISVGVQSTYTICLESGFEQIIVQTLK